MSPASLIPCQSCGYESPENARFCRSCGASLVLESDASGAATRNYGRQEAAPLRASAPLPSQPLRPSVVDSFGDDTRRQYVPPVTNTNPFAAPVAPPYGYAPPVPQYGIVLPPSNKRRRLLKWGLAAFALALAFGIGTSVNENHNNANLSRQEFALIENARREGRLSDTLTKIFDDVNSRSEHEMNDRIRQVERARDEARRAAERGTKLDLTGIPLLNLDSFEYAQATVSNAIRIPGKELTQQHVKGEFAEIVQHYERLLGKPRILQNPEDDDEKKALFQSATTPEQTSVSVLIKNSDEFDGQWEITIIRSPFTFPPSNEAVNAVRAAENKLLGAMPPPAKGVSAPPALSAPPQPPAKANKE